jgi:Tol biopolymer transport system component
VTWGLRPFVVAGVCLLVGAIAAVLGYRRLRPYPPPNADGWLVVIVALAGLLGLWAASLRTPAARKRAVVGAAALAAALPLVAAAVVPGVAQPATIGIPGGRTVVISGASGGTFDLYLVPGGDPSRLTALTETPDVNEQYPILDGTGSRIAYTLTNQDGSTEVHLMQLGSAEASDRLLVASGLGRVAPTAWTPDGALLVQVVPAHGRPYVQRVDVPTGGSTIFLRGAVEVAFAPDGATIAFSAPSAVDRENWDIWVARADGSRARDVADVGTDDGFPSWSPDGTTLAFTSSPRGNADVFACGAGGSHPRNLTADSDGRDVSNGWSADGHVLFLSDRSHTGGLFEYVMNADGSDVRLALRI